LKTIIKNIVARTYKPLLTKYLSKLREYSYADIHLQIPPQVFHPGFFFSTRLLLQYIASLSLQGHRFLEFGAGSGLISIHAAKNGAVVTATDINPVAIEFLKKNSRRNDVELMTIQSDMFRHIPVQAFDIIAINPPFYKKQPLTEKDHAWYCGKNGEYFQELFSKLGEYIHKNSLVLMVVSEECDIDMISKIAADRNFLLQKKITKKSFWEYLFIYQIVIIE
jgi:release factor glutamine methyltransferase